MNTFLFYILSAAVLLSAWAVVSVHNLFRAALGLIVLLIGVAGLYLLMDAQFLSAVQITVYVGGIVVLIVYVVMLVADASQPSFAPTVRWRKGLAGVLSLALVALVLTAIKQLDALPVAAAKAKSASVAEIGTALLSPGHKGFVLPFEIISVLLIAAVVGAITIARAGEGEKKEESK